MEWLPTFACLICSAIGHAFLCRVAIRGDFVMKAVWAGGAFGVGLGIWSWWNQGISARFWAALLVYGFLFELYIFLFTLVSTSVSVSLLLKLAKGGLSEQQISEIYSSGGMVAVRFEKLIRTGFLRREARGYSLSKKAWIVLSGFRALRFFFRHPRLQATAEVSAGSARES